LIRGLKSWMDFGDGIWFHLPPSFSSKLKKKSYSTMPKWGLKFYYKHSSWFWLNYKWLSSYTFEFTYPIWFVLSPTTPLVQRTCLLISPKTKVSGTQSIIVKYISNFFECSTKFSKIKFYSPICVAGLLMWQPCPCSGYSL